MRIEIDFSNWNAIMHWDDPRRNPYHNSDARPPGWLLCLIAVGVALAVTALGWVIRPIRWNCASGSGVALAVTALGWVILYLRDVFSARPLG